nr:transporter [Polaromonas glacialis]
MDVTAPTGSYDSNKLANLSRNYWNIEPVFAVTYVQPTGINADVKLMYDFNGTVGSPSICHF